MIKAIPSWRVALLVTLVGLISLPSKSHADQTAQASPTAKQHSVMKVVTQPVESAIPQVWLSTAHAKLCKVVVGEAFPPIKLPLLSGETTDLATLHGTNATVILFWHPDRWMARTALLDLERDVVKKFTAKQVAVVGIAVHQPSGPAQELVTRAKLTYPQLLDTNGEALAKVGTFALPRLYVLDAEGRVAWFDIEYSEGTRRELQQTLEVLTMAKQ